MTTNPVPASPPQAAPATRGVLKLRLAAYLIDLVAVVGFALIFLYAFVLLSEFIFGSISVFMFSHIFVFAYPVLVGASLAFGFIVAPAIVYSVETIAEAKQSTFGMRSLGLRLVDAASGQTIDADRAALHTLLFYLAVATFVGWVVDVGVGLFRSDGRLGRDLILDVRIARQAA